jgi:DNA-binding NtrC family response regulator
MIRIGLYSEDRTLRTLLSTALGGDFRVHSGFEADAIADLVERGDCDIAIFDLNSSRNRVQERIEFARWAIAQELPAIIMADEELRPTAFELVRGGAFGFCRRPPSIRDLKELLSRAYDHSPQREQAHAKKEAESPALCGRLIGSSPQMKHVYKLVHKVANLNAPVLVTGESGTGKELIARAIHSTGCRRDRPFVAVSCGAIPETLIEAELFGHEKGAFTGTTGAREGYFEQAADGTLFLDEIGDLSLFTQVKLLRVLQQMEFNRLGSNRLLPLRARVVFATHRNLAQLVAEGKFRQDLYYRINVIEIDSPALREHPEDIALLAAYFLAHYAKLFNKSIAGIEPEAMEVLQGYNWPGNVRELENMMQRAIILASGDKVAADDLAIASPDEEIAGLGDVVDIADYNPAGSFERQLRDYKIKLAANAVRENNGNKTLAARSLNISRAYLHRLLRLAEPGLIADPILREEATA